MSQDNEDRMREHNASELIDEQRAAEAIMKAAAEWRAKWPNHCVKCHGWGGFTFKQSHPYGMGSATETLVDPCEAIAKLETCHRCGYDGLTDTAEGPCKFCGWNYDDGELQL